MITSLQNPLVKQMRKLHRPKERLQQHLSLLEGTHLLEEACAVNIPLTTVCCTSDWLEEHTQLWERATQQAGRAEIVSPEVLQAIATTVQPDGVVASVARLMPRSPTFPVTLGVALETIQDPGNVGTLIRTAAAVGVDGLWISADSVDLDHPKVLRATAGQWFRLPMAVSADLKQDVTSFKQLGGQVIATLPFAQTPYWEIDWQQPSLILLGNEGAGLTTELAALADVNVTIPLMAGVESLNVAIAAAVILYEARRQREVGV
ncbi:RNA methyltransferase [Oscillatoria sp. FACHB-1407]|uniref:TrmH family RNA methyltransferase n=1 Tax=Oscillatoria sp. FACHB-1407 TaxID=2692847 RepID=UPI001686ADB9|nr:RNA methyltransferase [Oscillatoria sp. FACHB-1407]MBD2461790.1 RNA methyltransferase [Oscillatoria sp. FACHB-1407]